MHEYLMIYEVHMNLTLNRSSAIRRFKGSDAIEICDRRTFDIYMGLPHMLYWSGMLAGQVHVQINRYQLSHRVNVMFRWLQFILSCVQK